MSKYFIGTIKHIPLIFLILLTCAGYSQEDSKRSLSGTITDTDGEPLIGVNILERGTTNGTVTDLDGSFEIMDRATLRDAIRLERAKELVGEGNHRKLDLLRWGMLGEAIKARKIAENEDPDAAPNNKKVINVTADNFQEHMTTCPIPAAEILLNANLTQNPGY